jgi:hypothetical protein
VLSYQLYIDGAWTGSDGDSVLTVLNPATEEAIGQVPEGFPGVGEAGERHMQRVGGGEDDQLGVGRVPRQVGFQAGREKLGEPVHRGAGRAAERRRQGPGAGIGGGQHVDALGAELDGVRDRGVVAHPAVGEQPGAETHRRQQPRDGGAGEDGLDCRARRQPHLLPGQRVVRDEVQGDGGLL